MRRTSSRCGGCSAGRGWYGARAREAVAWAQQKGRFHEPRPLPSAPLGAPPDTRMIYSPRDDHAQTPPASRWSIARSLSSGNTKRVKEFHAGRRRHGSHTRCGGLQRRAPDTCPFWIPPSPFGHALLLTRTLLGPNDALLSVLIRKHKPGRRPESHGSERIGRRSREMGAGLKI
jgi:hypothetical protein